MLEKPEQSEIEELLGADTFMAWETICGYIESHYSAIEGWRKGYKNGKYEHKFRIGTKTLCTMYLKDNGLTFLMVYGKTERERFEKRRSELSNDVLHIYDNTEAFHDGKWVYVPVGPTDTESILKMIEIKKSPA